MLSSRLEQRSLFHAKLVILLLSVVAGAHNGKERPTSIPITRKVAAHDTPYTDPFAVCVRVRLHKINVK